MNIILIGFMGSGKSTVGLKLSQSLSYPFVDTDDLVEAKAGMKTPEIFESFGELKYREFEIHVAKDLRSTTNHIIATGGGVILNKIILDYMKEQLGITVFLRAPFVELARRVSQHDRPRPLFQDSDRAQELYAFRLPLYERYADRIIDTEGKNIETIAHEIIHSLPQ